MDMAGRWEVISAIISGGRVVRVGVVFSASAILKMSGGKVMSAGVFFSASAILKMYGGRFMSVGVFFSVIVAMLVSCFGFVRDVVAVHWDWEDRERKREREG